MNRRPAWAKIVLGLLAAGALLGVLLAAFLRSYPMVGAQAADELRKILGDPAVAQMEAVMFKVDDTVKSIEFRLGLAKSETPWTTTSGNQASTAGSGIQELTTATPTPTLANSHLNVPSAQQPTVPPSVNLVAPISPTGSLQWPPANLKPLGSLPGEGLWSAYIQDTAGRTVAYRTFLQPDANRPYAVVAVVAMNLDQVRLHFELGFGEPYETNVTQRSKGEIPAADLQPGVLLAAFNGGFKVRHGHFGAMANGLQSVPARDGLATLAFYQNGHVRMGVWGKDIQPAADMVAFRQNGQLILQNGAVTPQVDDPRLWGYTITMGTVTWRSALGLNSGGNVLYYFAGPYLNITTLAAAIERTDAQNAMELDINNYWVHFEAYPPQGGSLQPDPLFKEMKDGVGRFLKPYERDFFYVTAGG